MVTSRKFYNISTLKIAYKYIIEKEVKKYNLTKEDIYMSSFTDGRKKSFRAKGAEFIYESENNILFSIKLTKDNFSTSTKTSGINEKDSIDAQIEINKFLTELNKFLSLFGSIIFSGSVKDNLLSIISSEKRIEFVLVVGKLKESLQLQLTKIDRTFPQTKNKIIHELCIVQTTKKRKMPEPLDSLFLRGQQDFVLYEQLNPIEIKITDDTVINKLNKYKQIKHRFTLPGLLFPASIQTIQIKYF